MFATVVETTPLWIHVLSNSKAEVRKSKKAKVSLKIKVIKVVNLLRVFESQFFTKIARSQQKLNEIVPKFQGFISVS